MSEQIVNIDEKNYPIVIVKSNFVDLSEEQIDGYLEQMTEFYEKNRGKGVIVIYDTSLLRAVNAKGRIKVGEWLEEKSELIKSAVAGVCYVQKNILQKVILDGIFVIKNPEWPHKVVRSVNEGIEWGKALLEIK